MQWAELTSGCGVHTGCIRLILRYSPPKAGRQL